MASLPPRDRPHALIVDTTGLYTRCFFGCLKNNERERTPVAFAESMAKMLRARQPTHLAMARDPRGPLFRDHLYPEYKGNRPEKPDGFLRVEIAIETLLAGVGAPTFVRNGFEADDIIATATAVAVQNELPVVIASDDKDAEQCVRAEPLVVVWRDRTTVIGVDEVVKRRGVTPDLLHAAFALSGDESDNIPGVPGIGPKIAARILASSDGLEKILTEPWWCPVPSVRDALRKHREDVRLFLQLTKLRADAMHIELDWMQVHPLRLADQLLQAARPIEWHHE